MDKTVYIIIQDWHELFKNGIISENEFIAKKKELLDNDKFDTETFERTSEINTANIGNNYYDNYENIYEEESFISKYRLIIIFLIICSLIFGSFFYYEKNISITESSEPVVGTYIVNSSEENLVYFHTEPNDETKRKSYFSESDTVYVSKIENGFGYIEFINDQNQESKGWVKLESMQFYIKDKIEKIKKVSEEINLFNKVFFSAPEIDVKSGNAYGECDCCTGNYIFITKDKFVQIEYCEGDLSYMKGTYKINSENIILRFSDIVVDNTSEEDSTGILSSKITSRKIIPFTSKLSKFKNSKNIYYKNDVDNTEYSSIVNDERASKFINEFIKDGIWQKLELDN